METRRVCSCCSQELGQTAFYRHINDKTGNVCPGKKRRRLELQSECDAESVNAVDRVPVRSSSPRALDSTFDLSSSDEGEPLYSSPSYALITGDTFEHSSMDCDSSSSEPSSGEEIWEDSDNEDSSTSENLNVQVESIVSGLSFFLVFYHLLFHLSKRAITALLGFLRMLFSYLTLVTSDRLLAEVSSALPNTMHSFRSKFKADDYTEYVVCPKCCALYTFSECIVTNQHGEESKLCNFIEFPNHPHQSRRSSCNKVLMKKVKVGGKYKFIPKKTYVYCSVIKSLIQFVQRPGFLEKCEHWRNCQNEFGENVLGDVYEGRVWKDLFVVGERPFLQVPNNFCLALNIDWFNPYEETRYSVGAIYVVLLNLPRNERFKEENVILVGMIPGPKEPKNHINSFLAPFVHDMKGLSDGVNVHLSDNGLVTVLACIACDLPATQKVCGFSNFNATHGCSKYMKTFTTQRFRNKPLYNGFQCSAWIPRYNNMYIMKVFEYKQARTASECKSIVHQWGVRYSELVLLPYFDIVRFHMIDPMHCVFLGLAKYTIQTWRDVGVLQDKHFSLLQEKVDCIVPPSKIGRIPRKIESGFSSFTADEWKNWILYYSVFALYSVIEEVHYKCWCYLVDSCVTKSQIESAHILLVEYCKLFETIYGPEFCTPNMHMSCHLRECMLDYGPFSSFWCFPYERYNGLLEGISKSWVAPEKQMFMKFWGMQHLRQLSVLNESGEEFLSSVYKYMYPKETHESSSIGLTLSQDIIQLRNISCAVAYIDAVKSSYQCLMPPYKEKCFRDYELSYLQDVYSMIYPRLHTMNISRLYRESKKCIVNNEEYLSCYSSSQRSCAIAAKWCGISGINGDGEAPIRIGKVVSFIEHDLTITEADNSSSNKSHTFVRVKWYSDHPHRDYIHSSVIICSSIFDHESSASFMPISRIMCRCAISQPHTFKFDFGEDRVVFAVPFIKFNDDHE